jgi:hypothetical protein
MAQKKLTTLYLFRHRMMVAYVFILIALAGLLAAALIVPGGVTLAEQASTVRAMTGPTVGINAPYYLLQKTSVSLLGLSAYSIKLPSIILGAILGISLFMLLRRWLSLAIANFSAVIIFAGTTFLTIAGTGTPLILYVLFPALLLFFGTRVLAHDRGLVLFALLLLVTIALALLTPTMIYLLALALVIATVNPHVRYGFRRLPLWGRALLILGFVLTLAPLAYLIFKDPMQLRQILALPTSMSLSGVLSNGRSLLGLFGSFLHPGLAQGMPVPLVGLAGIGLAVLGLYQIIRCAYTTRAQFILGWSIIALIIALLDPGYGILLYLPIVLLASIGLSQLAAIWYRTFPLNPYARVSALIPIGILIIGVVVGSTLRYVNTTVYASGSEELYSHDLTLLRHYAEEQPKNSAFTLAVAESEVSFYQGLNKSGALYKLVAGKVISTSEISANDGQLVSSQQLRGHGVPIRILTDGRAWNADRFYVYRR